MSLDDKAKQIMVMYRNNQPDIDDTFDDVSCSADESEEDLCWILKKKKNKFLKDIEKASLRKNKAYSKAMAGDHVSTMLNNAKNTGVYQDNVVTLLQQNLGSLVTSTIKDTTDIQSNHPLLGMIVIFQHSHLAKLPKDDGDEMLSLFCELCFALGPDTAVRKLASILQDPDLGMQPVQRCRKAAVLYLLGVPSVDAAKSLAVPNVGMYFTLFGKCKKGEECKNSDACSLGGDGHSLHKCSKVDAGV